MIAALAFVPPDDVASAFEALTEYVDDELQPVLDYFEDNFIGRIRRRGSGKPRYDCWNLFQTAVEGLSRSNNGQEGWHNTFRIQTGGNHLTLWKVLDAIRRKIA